MSDLCHDETAGVVRLVLNRPESRNALTTAMLTELVDRIATVRRSRTARAVVLAGAGTTFCAGADLKEFADTPDAPGREHRIDLVGRAVLGLQELDQPSIAVVSGAAYGAGWGLALACDLTYATASAQFSLPEVRKGLTLPTPITSRLTELVGPARATRIVLSGEAHDARAGLKAGWVAETFADEAAARAQALALAAEVSGYPATAVAAAKDAIRRTSTRGTVPPKS